MPVVPGVEDSAVQTQLENSDAVKTYHVLATGFGPFMRHQTNPSWLAVKELHDVTISSDQWATLFGSKIQSARKGDAAKAGKPSKSKGKPSTASNATPLPEPGPFNIHISAFEMPVVYEAVLDIVPGLHARPPKLPTSSPHINFPYDFPAPPEAGYDFIFHVGVAGPGPLQIETIGHKHGYNLPDAKGNLCPFIPETAAPSKPKLKIAAKPIRGFGVGYETFPRELKTPIDVQRLVQDLKASGISQVYPSMDAGHYLCDFIFYCSLAQSERHTQAPAGATTVLFMHCPPLNEPLSTEEVTEGIRRTVLWVCRELEVEKIRENVS